MMKRLAFSAAAVLLLACGGCTTSSTNIVEPTTAKCAVSVPENLPSIGHAGGAASVEVGTAPECVWTAASESDWITLSNDSGQGPGSVTFTAAANPNGTIRQGSVTVADSRVAVTQQAAPCQFALDPGSASVGAAGGEGSVELKTLAGCEWTATSNAPWLSIVGSPAGSGSRTIRYSAAPNTGVARRGVLTIAGIRFGVNQDAAAPTCTPSLSRTQQSVGAAGGADEVTVTLQDGCTWTASSQVPWITITGAASGTGTGTVRLAIAPNAGPARTGTVTIAGLAYTVQQASQACTYSLGSTGLSAPAAGTTASVSVSAPNGCQWTAVSQADWITVTSGASGSGNGSVGLSVAANTGPSRTGTVTIAGQTFTVTQAAAPAPVCAYALDDTGESMPAAGGTTTVGVTTTAGCAWTAASDDPWITVTSGATGTGSGSVGLTIAENEGDARVGTVEIAGETFTVTQAAAPIAVSCSYSLDPVEQSAAALGGTFDVDVATSPTCDWTASSSDDWIELTGATSGTGSATVGYQVLPLPVGTPSRTGTITISGETLTVSQEVAP
jgi:hypothetical protein